MDHETIRLLKDRFDLADGEAEHILGSFVDAVERNLEEFGICHVTGVGSFVRAPGDSRISFEPAEALRRAVNVRFADLPVYEIDPDVTSRSESESAGAGPAPESRPDQSRSAPPPSARERTPDRTSERPIEPRPPVANPPEREVPSTESSVPDASSAASSPSDSSPPDSTSPDSTSPDARPPLTRSRTPHKRRQKSSGGSKAVWFVVPLLIALVAAAVWFMQRPESEPVPLATDSAPASPEAGAGADDDADTGETPRQDAVDDPAQEQTDPPVDVETAAEPDEVVVEDDAEASEIRLDRTVDGYTMIVGSSPDRAAADEQISRFTELDLPYGVLDYSEDGSSMYRLAVGLFDSAEQADSARQAMADTLPSGTWVWRIR